MSDLPPSPTKSASSTLSSKLVSFRKWIQTSGCTVHPAICIVNGEATDGTKNAPVLLLDTSNTTNSHGGDNKQSATAEGRCGLVGSEEDRVLYDRTIGCQVRTVREIKEDQVMMTVPRSVMIHPDLIAASDAGRAVLACCEPLQDTNDNKNNNFWDAFGNTTEKEKYFMDKNGQSNGTKLLVKILQERKRVENVLSKAAKAIEESNSIPQQYKLAKQGSISTRAPVLCFLIQQRFAKEESPPVIHNDNNEFNMDKHSFIDDASESVERIKPTTDTPHTFAPYARTLPPAIPLPICWKRNELALLANCISGVSLLTEIASQIMTLADDLINLVEAGIFHRFPHLFNQHILTWDRWLWAASVHASRLLPATCYLNKGELKARDHKCATGERFYSPPDVWDELGVMVPLIDMLNHESDASQIQWESPSQPGDEGDDKDAEVDVETNVAKVIMHKRVKKGLQIYTNYGIESNKELLLRYGFAQMANPEDTTSIGWGLGSCVGNITCPDDYTPIDSCSDEERQKDAKSLAYETLDADEIRLWWTEKRLRLLENQIRSNAEFWTMLRSGKKMTATVHYNGSVDPILLTAVVVATMSPNAMEKFLNNEKENKKSITITKRHQRIIRKYLLFLFTQKLEKLLSSLDKGIGNHFNNIKLWTKVTEGGLKYKSDEKTGWNSFYDSLAYNAAMEVEKGCFYSMAPEGCVLTLYDGQIRALQSSIDSVISQEKFDSIISNQLVDLDFILSDQEGDDTESHKSSPQKQNGKGENEKKSRRNRRSRGNKNGGGAGGGNGPTALKLHIGNLSYQTPPGRLFDFFASQYGSENVIECHIPTEKETGKSRGFGFVTMPEAAARRVLADNLAPHIDGRIVKIAESNTTARTHTNGVTVGVGTMGDRCGTCGYRPRYCTCVVPNLPGYHMPGGPMPMMGSHGPVHLPPPEDIYGPGPIPHGGMDPYYGRGMMSSEYDPRGGRRRSRSFNRGRSYSRSRSPSPRYRRSGEARYNDRPYSRDRRGRSYSRSRSRSRSRSYSRGRDRRDRRDRDRDWDREGRGHRSRGSRRSSRYSRSRSTSLSRSRSRSRSHNSKSKSRSPSYPKDRREKNRERKSNTGSSDNMEASNTSARYGGRSRSTSVSPNQNREVDIEPNVKDSSKSNRRARSRSRERSSKSRKRHKSSRRSKEKRPASRSPSRSRSF